MKVSCQEQTIDRGPARVLSDDLCEVWV
jgi:hypothetical protein